jgi:hypothetical protein
MGTQSESHLDLRLDYLPVESTGLAEPLRESSLDTFEVIQGLNEI